MPAIPGLRSPYDKAAGGLHHLGRMIDKIRLQHAGNAVQGEFTARVALDRMVAGTDLVVSQDERTGALTVGRPSVVSVKFCKSGSVV